MSPAASLGASNIEQLERHTWALAAGGGVRIAYGLLNMLELGVTSQFLTSRAVGFDEVLFAQQPGRLTANLYSIDAELDLRLVGGVHLSRSLARFRPFLGVRGGGLVRILTDQQLLDPSGLLVMRARDDVSLLPAATGYLGAELRVSRAWTVGLDLEATYATSAYRSAFASVEVSWLTY